MQTAHWGSPTGAVSLLLGLLLAGGPPVTLHAQQPALSGHWELVGSDTTLAPPDTTHVLSDSALRQDRDSTGAEMPGERNRPMPRGRYRGPDKNEREQLSKLMGMAQPAPAFSMNVVGDSIVVTNDDGFSYRLHPDGEKDSLRLSDSLSVEYRSRYKDGNLTVEWKPSSGGSIDELYVLADSRKYLRYEVTVHSPGFRRPIWRVRMYKLSEPNGQGGDSGPGGQEGPR